MKFAVDLSALDVLKTDLRAAIPTIPAAHRVEALARGLGFNTNAAMRAALAIRPRDLVPDDEAFQAYLADRDLRADPRTLRRTLARLGLRRAMDAEPQLTITGYGIAWDFYKTPEATREALMRLRAELLDDWSADQFELAMLYLSQLERRKTLNRSFSTYNLKHQAERLSRERGIATHLGNYVCNGVFIAAAMEAGFTVRRCSWYSLNAFINATTPSIEAAKTGQLIKRDDISAIWRMLTAQAA